MLARRQYRRAPRRRGASTAEFAAVAPVLFLLIVGTVEVGRLGDRDQPATGGSREVARFAAQAPAVAGAVQAYARTYLAATGPSPGAVSSATIEQPEDGQWVEVASLSAAAGTPARVTQSADFDRASWLPSRFFVGDATVMRKE